jgi:hypothetical protein
MQGARYANDKTPAATAEPSCLFVSTCRAVASREGGFVVSTKAKRPPGVFQQGALDELTKAASSAVQGKCKKPAGSPAVTVPSAWPVLRPIWF